METEKFIKNQEGVFHQEVVSRAREAYDMDYKDEMRLNEKFNQFVTNYKAAYEGENTRKEQAIGVSFSKQSLAAESRPIYIF